MCRIWHWHTITCNLNRICAAKEPLPFSAPFDTMWLSITKIIDSFDFRNYTNPDCKQKYSPFKMKIEHPTYNTQSGEQTFVWASHFKHIVCAMTKRHHLFFLHWMVKRTVILQGVAGMVINQCYPSQKHKWRNMHAQTVTIPYYHYIDLCTVTILWVDLVVHYFIISWKLI